MNTKVIVSEPNEIFSKIKKEDFKQLLEVANQYQPLQIEELYQSYINGNKNLIPILERWEQSVFNGNPDFSVYEEDAYINESFICWKEYSRRYLLLLQKYLQKEECEINKNDIHSILDLGCGCGYTTIGLKALFPEAIISATNIKDTVQYAIDNYVTENINDCIIYDEKDAFSLNNVDMIFASEFFEHLNEPIDYLLKLINAYHPKYFIFANTFTKMAIGHFTNYLDKDCEYTGKEISRKFNNTLRQNGYVKVKAGFFNDRPQIFKLVNKSEEN